MSGTPRSLLALAALAAAPLVACGADGPSVELVRATAVECPLSGGYVLLVDGRTDSFACEAPVSLEEPDVIAGQIFCSAALPELLITINARIIFTADGYVLGLCSLSAPGEGLTSSQAFDPAAMTCSLPSYGTSSVAPVVISVTDSGVLLSGAIEGRMSCEAVEL